MTASKGEEGNSVWPLETEVFQGPPMDCYLATWWVFEIASDDPQICAWRDHFASLPTQPGREPPLRSGRARP